MKIVVDTNIVFSALINTQSQIADLLMNSLDVFDFYSCYLLHDEIQRHRSRLLTLSGMTEVQLNDAQFQIFASIQFISEEHFSYAIWQESIPLVRDVDMDDIAFVALTEYISGKLWTGDKQLIKGLEAKGYTNLLTTENLQEIRRNMERK